MNEFDEKQPLLTSEVLVKSNALARAVWSPESVWQMRIIGLLITKINPTDEEFTVLDVPLEEILKLRDDDDRSLTADRIKLAVRKLAQRTAEFYDFANGIFRVKPFFSMLEADFTERTLTAQFNDLMKPELLMLRERFCRQDLLLWSSISSKHTLQLYDMLSTWGDKLEVIYHITILHEKLNSPESLKKNFYDFERRILLPAQKTLSGTDVSFDYEAIKNGRKVSSVRFIFNTNLANRNSAPMPEQKYSLQQKIVEIWSAKAKKWKRKRVKRSSKNQS